MKKDYCYAVYLTAPQTTDPSTDEEMTDYKNRVTSYIAMYVRDVLSQEVNNEDLACYDVVYTISKALAQVFVNSDYDDGNAPLYDCIVKFMENSSAAKLVIALHS